MATTLDMLQRGSVIKPPRIVIYGPHGIGKTSLACSAPNPVLLQVEEGAGMLDVLRTPLLTTFADLLEAVDLVGTNPNLGVQTLVLDTVDAAEVLVHAETCARNRWADIETPGYGKGYAAALDTWRELFTRCNMLRDHCGIATIFLAHAKVQRYDAPDTDGYDRYQIKLQDSKNTSAAALLQEHVDCVLFNNWRTTILRDQQKGDKKGEGRTRGVGGGQRLIHTEERPAFLAKNRYSMPDMIELPNDTSQAWGAVARHLPFYNQPAPAAAA